MAIQSQMGEFWKTDMAQEIMPVAFRQSGTLELEVLNIGLIESTHDPWNQTRGQDDVC